MADDVKLPTKEEIANLPRWARLAFAARCARRAFTLVNPDSLTQLSAEWLNVRDALEAAERSAGRDRAGLSRSSDVYTALGRLRSKFGEAEVRARALTAGADEAGKAYSSVVAAAARVVEAVWYATDAITDLMFQEELSLRFASVMMAADHAAA